MKIALASDHAGFEYKEQIKKLLLAEGHQVRDFGTNSSERVCGKTRGLSDVHSSFRLPGPLLDARQRPSGNIRRSLSACVLGVTQSAEFALHDARLQTA